MKQDKLHDVSSGSFETFGPYIFLKKLAAGGMAEVFLARPASQDGNGRVQVVKRILPHIANHSLFLNMFQREIRIIMGFNHPNTVQLHDAGNINGQPFIAMEYIEGKNLKDVVAKFMKKKQKLPIPMTLSLVAQAASGLSYAHTFVNKVTGEELHAIHRDITPHNLILSYEGNLKVIDFGIAKAACSIHEMTQTGVLKGKVAYFAPEQVEDQSVDARTDVFALGIVAWELLTLQRLFMRPGDSEVLTMARVHNCEAHIVAPSTVNADVPREVDEIILKALKKNPAERFQTAREFQVALRQVMQRHYPDYSYADTGSLVSELFAEEIASERKDLRELNLQAQSALATIQGDDDTTLVSAPQVAGANVVKVNAPEGSGNEHVTITDGSGLSQVDLRLMKIEAMMKQKATTRHYVMLALYIVSLVVLKLSDRFDIFGFLLPEAAQMASEQNQANLGSGGSRAARGPAKAIKKAPAKRATKPQ